MAQLYFNEQEYAEVMRLQSEIQQQQTRVADAMSVGDTAAVKTLSADMDTLRKALEQAAKAAAVFAGNLSGVAKQNIADQVFSRTQKYMADYRTTQKSFDEKAEAASTPKEQRKVEREREKAYEELNMGMEADLKKLDASEISDAIEMTKKWLNESYQAQSSGVPPAENVAAASETPPAEGAAMPAPADTEQMPSLDIGAAKSKQEVDAVNNALDNVTTRLKEVNKASPEQLAASFKKLDDAFGTVNKNLDALGAALGDGADDAIGAAKQIFTFYQGMMGGIGNLATAISSGIKIAGTTTMSAMNAVEMASVILAVISAVMQIATTIANLFNNDKYYKKLQDESKLIEKQLKFELEHASAKAIEEKVHAVDMLTEAYGRYQISLLNYMQNGQFMSRAEYLRNDKTVVEQLIKSYTELGYTVTEALGEQRYESSGEQIQNLVAQQKELYIQMDAEQNKKKSSDEAIEDYNRQIQELGEKIVQVLADMTKSIIGGSAAEISTKLGDAFIDAFKTGGDAAQAWKDKVDDLVADIVRRMIIQKFVEPAIGKVFNDYQKIWFKDDGSFNGIGDILKSMPGFKDSLNSAMDEIDEFMTGLLGDGNDPNGILGNLGYDPYQQAGSSSTPFQTMSEDTAGELNGRFTDLQAKTSGLLQVVSALSIQSTLAQETQTQIRDIAAETRELAGMGYLQLVQIADNTGAVVVPIRNMAEQLNTISSQIRDL